MPVSPPSTHVHSEDVDVAEQAPLWPPGIEPAKRAITPRVVFLCLGIGAAFGYLIPVVDYKFTNTFLGATHLPPGAVGALLVLLLIVNPLLQVLAGPRYRFSRDEMLVVYISCLFSCLIPGIGGNNYFTSFIIGSFYYASKENGWFEVLKVLPHWMTPALNADGTYNAKLVEGWYVGLPPGQNIPWAQWALPLLMWGGMMLVSFWTLCCLSVMLRAQWGEREALSFPLLKLPLALTEGLDEVPKNRIDGLWPPFFREPVMWIGFAIAVVIQGLNGLHLYFPDLPSITMSVDTGTLFTEAPWNQLGWVPIVVWPIGIGMAFLLPAEISFSMWMFFWLMKFQLMGAYMLGFPPNSLPNSVMSGSKIFINYQETGAHLAFVGIIFWTAREHLAHIWRRATLREKAQIGERGEVLSYPVAFWGFVLGFIALIGWSVYAGVSPVLATVAWVSWLVIAIVLSRVVAAGGLIFVHHNWMPLATWGQLVGTGPGSMMSTAHGIIPAAVIEASTVQDYRASLMPSFVQSWKLAYDRGIPGRKLGLLILAVTVVTFIIGLQMNVRMGYDNGGLSMQSWLRESGPKQMASNAKLLSQPVPDVSWTNWIWLTIGVGFTLILTALRAHFAWFPLHPIGYVMAVTYPASTLWFSMFTGWTCKTLITKFGGYDSYKRALPGFLGLALGDVFMMLLWICIDGWQGRVGHQLMPG